MARKFPLQPVHPERICWGCDNYCPTHAMRCGNGSSRTQHPCELLGEDWYRHGDWGIECADDEEGGKATAAAVGARSS